MFCCITLLCLFLFLCFVFFFFSSRRRHTRCALVTGVQTCALPISTFYHADTPTHAIRAYDVDKTAGTLAGGRLFHQFEHGNGRPDGGAVDAEGCYRSEEHTSELQSLMRISYAVFCLKKKKKTSY